MGSRRRHGLWLVAAQGPPAAAEEAPDSPLYGATLQEAIDGLQGSALVTNGPLTATDVGALANGEGTLPPGGIDILDTRAQFNVFMQPDCLGPPTPIMLEGPTTVARSDPSGELPNVIQTEILAMDLSGQTPFGRMELFESPTLPSLGQVISPGPEDFPVDSFFDVFFEVTLNDGPRLRSQEPLHVQAPPVTALPPFGATYQSGPSACVTLFDNNNEPLVSVANVGHTVVPPRFTTEPNNPVTVCRTEFTKCGPYTHCSTDPTYQCPRPTQWPVEVATRCPTVETPTVCPIKSTKCPVRDTVCPSERVPTVCPISRTKCPQEETACPKIKTQCPGNVPTKHPVQATQCPKKRTSCPEIGTKCPAVATECPAKKTTCAGVATVCPANATACPKQLTKCPGVATRCPPQRTVCPPKRTSCPGVPTKCPATVTACAKRPTKCVNVATICPKTATVCPKVTQCPPHLPPPPPPPNPFPPGCSEVIINELMWDGTDLGSDDEYLELRNLCPNDVGITGWTIRKNDVVPPMVFLRGIIPANGYFLVSRRPPLATRVDGAPSPHQVEPALDLDDMNVQYQLYDSAGILRDRADDGKGKVCAGTGAPNYYSMERNDPPLDGSLCRNWHTATRCVNFDPAFCPNVLAQGFCLGGSRNGLGCTVNADCPADTCTGGFCGASGIACLTNADCPPGTCQGAGPQGLGTPGNRNIP